MFLKIGLLAVCFALFSWTSILGQATKTTYPQPTEDTHVTEDFGDCTLSKNTDSRSYVRPALNCKSGDENFALVPQENGEWGILIATADKLKLSEDEQRTGRLRILIKVDDKNAHSISMIAFPDTNFAFMTFELADLNSLIDELTNGDTMILMRGDQRIEFDISRANLAFPKLVYEQMLALRKVDDSDRQ